MKKIFQKKDRSLVSQLCASCSNHTHTLGVLLLVSVLFVFGTLSAYLFQKTRVLGNQDIASQTVTIIGEATVSGHPNIALIQAGLETTENTVEKAIKQNTEKMNGFLGQLPALGIQKKDRKTITYSIQPKYEYRNDTADNKSGGLPHPVLAGYTVLNTIQIKVRETSRVGEVLSAIGAAGLNQVGDFSFTIDDPAPLKTQAMEEAVQNAQQKAARFAALTGSRIGGVISFYENTDLQQPTPLQAAPLSPYRIESDPIPTTETGEHEVKTSVTITYEILR